MSRFSFLRGATMKSSDFSWKRVGLIAVLTLSVSVLIPNISGQTNRSSIGGMVFDEQRNPVSMVPVELMNDFTTVTPSSSALSQSAQLPSSSRSICLAMRGVGCGDPNPRR